ncbi:MAG: hypothetical protein IJ459_01990 [Clostridia bacterium]|nr:hypothetical protein [Clostridia bacterium]
MEEKKKLPGEGEVKNVTIALEQLSRIMRSNASLDMLFDNVQCESPLVEDPAREMRNFYALQLDLARELLEKFF